MPDQQLSTCAQDNCWPSANQQCPGLAPDLSLRGQALAAPTMRWRLLLVMFSITMGLSAACYFVVDRQALEFVHHLDPSMHTAATTVSRLGEAEWPVIVSATLLGACLVRRRPSSASLAGFALASTAATGLAAQALKVMAGRYRPAGLLHDHHWGFRLFSGGYQNASFPSGHACTAAGMCTVLWLIWPRWWPLWIVLFIVVAASRIVSEAHFVSDVVAGAFVGAAGTLILHRFWPGIVSLFQRSPQRDGAPQP